VTRRVVRFAASCAALSSLAVIAFVVAPGGADAAPSSDEGSRLVAQMRTAPDSLRFTGVLELTWVDHGERKARSVDIADDRGAIEITSNGTRVFDEGTHTYFENGIGWSSALVEDRAATPRADHRWPLTVEAGPMVAGRPTQVVAATRADGTPAQRLFLDRATGLLLRRQVLDANGRVERSLTFVDLTIDGVAEVEPPSGVRTEKARPLEEVPSGYEAPTKPGGYVLVGRSRRTSGIELRYSDGLFAVSVVEQRGELDWDGLPARGVATDVAGSRARRYSEAGADVVVWERDGTVYTLASDAPSDVVDSLISGLTPARSTLEKIADYVLGPFGWS
jgi:sigma-E factor negative regulatory protein RseB